MLPLSRSYAFLTVNRSRHLTPAGSYYYNETGLTPPTQQVLNHNQDKVVRGSSQYVRDAHGNMRAVRRVRPDGSTHVTDFGYQYYRGRNVQYIVSIPVKVTSVDRHGNERTRQDHIPSDLVGGYANGISSLE